MPHWPETKRSFEEALKRPLGEPPTPNLKSASWQEILGVPDFEVEPKVENAVEIVVAEIHRDSQLQVAQLQRDVALEVAKIQQAAHRTQAWIAAGGAAAGALLTGGGVALANVLS